MSSQFAFLASEWPEFHEAATRAEAAAVPDPRTACFHARRALESAITWAFKHDRRLKLPYNDNLSALVHEPTFRNVAGAAVFNKARLLTRLGNEAVHSHAAVPADDAVAAVRELFHIAYWLAATYTRGAKPPADLAFNRHLLPTASVPKQTMEQLQALEAKLHERDEKLSDLLAANATLDAELARLRAEVEQARIANEARPDTHDYSEAETRDAFIDLLLREAGWTLSEPRDREYEVRGMPNREGRGFVDYVLWGDDGKPLGLVEAKRARRDPRVGEQQAKLYADCLEREFGQRPVIFYTNGYEHWMWGDLAHPPRPVQGFYTKDELQLLVQRRATRRPLGEASINPAIVERYYQTRAIRRIGEAFEKDHARKALLVMATGAGKTRTVIALADVLIRCNWAKRVLFLADRKALVKQAVNAFKKHLPDSSPVNLVTDKETEGRVYVSTYPTMMGLIDEMRNGQRRFGVGHFDLIVIDEAHRSIFKKYRALFDYFDAYLVGLTATPKDEVDRNTYRMFDLEDGVPTDAYSLDEAVRDGFLVPAEPVSVPLKFQREGITYDELPEEEKEEWDELEWDEDEGVPRRVEPEAINKWLFNKDTVDKVLAHLMDRGFKVEGGDRIGKTIIFAKNQEHADFIAERFNLNFRASHGEAARVITHKTEYVETLIETFSDPKRMPDIAISVDMLDTGIDVPEVVNLAFFKVVHSRTKFWQMIGRGTRLRPDLFGPGQHKRSFYLFDYCGNLEFFRHNDKGIEGSTAPSLSERLFHARLDLVVSLEGQSQAGEETQTVRAEAADWLRGYVSAMNVESFVVRPKRRAVEKYARPEAWDSLGPEERNELLREVAPLPSDQPADVEEAKRFDLLLFHLELAHLRVEPAFVRLRGRVQEIAGLLEEKSSVPVVQEHLSMLHELQGEEWWEGVTLPMLETVRKRLRTIVHLIDKKKRIPLFTDFEDTMGSETRVTLAEFGDEREFERFRAKVRAFLREHLEHPAVRKLRLNELLNQDDLKALESILAQSGVGGPEDIARATREADGLGLFVRNLVGIDREAAKQALAGFLSGKTLNANQIEFVNLVVDQITEHGVMEVRMLYESPFTDVAPRGPESLFTPTEVGQLVATIHRIRVTASPMA